MCFLDNPISDLDSWPRLRKLYFLKFLTLFLPFRYLPGRYVLSGCHSIKNHDLDVIFSSVTFMKGLVFRCELICDESPPCVERMSDLKQRRALKH
jgi:hypothetical protein